MDALCVLVVDDDEDIRQVTRELLESAGYRVAEARSVEGTLHFLATSAAPLVVLLDFLLPPDDATPVLHYLVTHPQVAARCAVITFPATPSLLTPEYTALAEHLGAPSVAKPFDLDTLLAAVAERAAGLRQRGAMRAVHAAALPSAS